MTSRASALALTVALLAGCAAAPSFDLQITRLSAGASALSQTSGFTGPANVVVRDQAAWEELWATIYANVTPRPELPVIDFSRHTIVARAMGPRQTGGYNVVITGLLRQSGEYLLQVRETSPGQGCAVTQALTSPVDVARIAHTDDPIKFAVATETKSCS